MPPMDAAAVRTYSVNLMKRSVVTWHLNYSGIADLEEAKRLLGPIVHSEAIPDPINPHHGWGASGGPHGYRLVEPEREITGGELALSCLTKAHRLGLGWVIRWPSVLKAGADGGIRTEDARRAVLPDSLHELSGWFDPTYEHAASVLPNLHSAGFNVRIVEPAHPPVDLQVPRRPSPPAPEPVWPPEHGRHWDVLTQAVVLWTGFGLVAFAKRDEARVITALGAEAAAAVMPIVRELSREFERAEAFHVPGDIGKAAALAAAEFRKKHPDVSEDAVRALSWDFACAYR